MQEPIGLALWGQKKWSRSRTQISLLSNSSFSTTTKSIQFQISGVLPRDQATLLTDAHKFTSNDREVANFSSWCVNALWPEVSYFSVPLRANYARDAIVQIIHLSPATRILSLHLTAHLTSSSPPNRAIVSRAVTRIAHR